MSDKEPLKKVLKEAGISESDFEKKDSNTNEPAEDTPDYIAHRLSYIGATITEVSNSKYVLVPICRTYSLASRLNLNPLRADRFDAFPSVKLFCIDLERF